MAIKDPTSATIGDDRIDIARQAAWHIEALADCILRELSGTDEMAAHSIAVRVKNLACVQMGALSDDAGRESVGALHLQLTGTHRAQEVGHGQG